MPRAVRQVELKKSGDKSHALQSASRRPSRLENADFFFYIYDILIAMQKPDLILPAIADGEDKSSPFKNRIRKNYRHLRKWAKRTVTDCFRIYDRDVKGYPVGD